MKGKTGNGVTTYSLTSAFLNVAGRKTIDSFSTEHLNQDLQQVYEALCKELAAIDFRRVASSE
jgi:hypothetical protein